MLATVTTGALGFSLETLFTLALGKRHRTRTNM